MDTAIALDKYGDVHVWGQGNTDKLREVLRVPKDVKNIVKVAAGYRIMIAVDADCKIHMWGNSKYVNCCIPPRFCL